MEFDYIDETGDAELILSDPIRFCPHKSNVEYHMLINGESGYGKSTFIKRFLMHNRHRFNYGIAFTSDQETRDEYAEILTEANSYMGLPMVKFMKIMKKIQQEDAKGKKANILFIFDDLDHEDKFFKSEIFKKMMFTLRHAWCKILFVVHDIKMCPTSIRGNFGEIIQFGNSSPQNVSLIGRNISPFPNKDDFKRVMARHAGEKFRCLYINKNPNETGIRHRIQPYKVKPFHQKFIFGSREFQKAHYKHAINPTTIMINKKHKEPIKKETLEKIPEQFLQKKNTK